MFYNFIIYIKYLRKIIKNRIADSQGWAAIHLYG